jgi:predicted DNA-binding protein
MARTETMVQLTDELRQLLDAEAERRGISRSALIREAIASHLKETGEAAVTEKIVEGYRRIPPTTPDDWGGLEAAGDHATRELLQRLDAEERASGEGGW